MIVRSFVAAGRSQTRTVGYDRGGDIGSEVPTSGRVMKPHEMVDRIQSKADLVEFIEALVADFRAHPENWENDSLERYLSALGNWLSDSDGYCRSRGLEAPVTPTWKNVADMLIAAKMYE